ncbi:MAG: VWA-like domain-containing protein [Magnetococcus sp. YQC-3]
MGTAVEMETAKEKLRIAFMRIMNCKEINLFGSLIYKFNVDIIDDEKLTAFVFFNGKKPNIVFGMQLINRHNTLQITFVMLHEMLHFINCHHTRGTRFDRVISNMAADHVINELLMKDLGMIDDEKGGKTKNVIGNVVELCVDPPPFVVNELLGKNYTFEGTYEWLMKNKVQYVQIQQECSTCGGSGKSQGQSQNQSQDQNGKPQKQPQDQNGESQNQSEQECPDCSNKTNGKTKYKVKIKGQPDQEYTPDIDSSQNGEDQDEAAKETSEEFKSDLRAILNILKQKNQQRGFESGNIVEFIEKLTKVKIPWTELLDRAIRSSVVQSFENRAWKNPMKRMRAHGLMFPGHGTELTASKMVVCIDTSGSVGSDDLTKFLSICKDSLVHFEEILVIQHDYKVTKVTVVDKQNMESGLDEVAHFEGRGGTSHTDVFKFIEENLWHEEAEVGLVIMLTDYYSDVNENFHSGHYNWVKDYPIKIVLNHSQINMVHVDVDEKPIVITEDND